MDNSEKNKERANNPKENFPEKEKDWDNPKNPEAPHDARDVEQIQRQLEEAKRRKENLTDDEH